MAEKDVRRILSDAWRNKITVERRLLTGDLERTIRLAETARKGADSCVGLAGHAAITLLPGADELQAPIRLLLRDLERLIDSQLELPHPASLVRTMMKTVVRWEIQKWDPAIARVRQHAVAAIREWCETASKNLKEYFLPLTEKMPSRDLLVQVATPDCEMVLEQASPLLGNLQESSAERIKDLCETLNQDFVLSLLRMVRKIGSTHIGGKKQSPSDRRPPPRRGRNPGLQLLDTIQESEKTRIKELLSYEIGKFRQSMVKILHESVTNINPMLRNAMENCASGCLDLAADIVEESKNRLDILDQAEQMLRNGLR
jgi:hypothetical protein